MFPQNSYVEVLITPLPVCQNVTVFGNRVFKEEKVRVKMRSLVWALIHMTGVLVKRGN